MHLMSIHLSCCQKASCATPTSPRPASATRYKKGPRNARQLLQHLSSCCLRALGGAHMPVIRITQRTWERLKKHATPLVHTANDVVEMALEALDGQARKRGTRVHARKSRSAKKKSSQPKAAARPLPSTQFRACLLDALFRQGGRAYSREIREIMEQTLAPVLDDADYESVSNGQPRWWNSICSMRNQLIADGLLRDDSKRGIWELSKEGLRQMRQSRA